MDGAAWGRGRWRERQRFVNQPIEVSTELKGANHGGSVVALTEHSSRGQWDGTMRARDALDLASPGCWGIPLFGMRCHGGPLRANGGGLDHGDHQAGLAIRRRTVVRLHPSLSAMRCCVHP